MSLYLTYKVTLTTSLTVDIDSVAIEYSNKYWLTQWTIASELFLSAPCLISFRLDHNTQATVTTKATLSSSNDSIINKNHNKSKKEWNWPNLREVGSFVQPQISLEQDQNKWTKDSKDEPHLSQIQSCSTRHLHKFSLVGSMSQQARQAKWRTLCGTGKCHSFFQNDHCWLFEEAEATSTDWWRHIATL